MGNLLDPLPGSIRKLIALVASTAAISGFAVPAGFAQYGEAPILGSGSAPAGTATSKAFLRKKCIAKAQTKFGSNIPKKKAAIRQCKKKFR